MTSSAVVAAASDAVTRLTRWRDDFPVPGIRFADLTPVFADSDGYRAVIDSLTQMAPEVELVASIDARGFLLGGGVAAALRTGVLAVRKAGKLPPPVSARSYELEYGTAGLEIPAEGVELAGKRVLLLDDVLATGGTMRAAAELLSEAGADVVAVAAVLELTALGGRVKLDRWPTTSLVAI